MNDTLDAPAVYAYWVTTPEECRHCKGTGRANFNRWVTSCCSAMVRFQSMTGEAYCSQCHKGITLPSIWKNED